MSKFVKELGGVYKEGPLKSAERILAKSQSDYNNDFKKVLDVIRASAVFHSLEDLNNAIVSLMNPGCEITVVRFKDRVTQGLVSGYRDCLINVKINGFDGWIVELQLHLHDIIELKSEGHKICEYASRGRAGEVGLGWMRSWVVGSKDDPPARYQRWYIFAIV